MAIAFFFRCGDSPPRCEESRPYTVLVFLLQQRGQLPLKRKNCEMTRFRVSKWKVLDKLDFLSAFRAIFFWCEIWDLDLLCVVWVTAMLKLFLSLRRATDTRTQPKSGSDQHQTKSHPNPLQHSRLINRSSTHTITQHLSLLQLAPFDLALSYNTSPCAQRHDSKDCSAAYSYHYSAHRAFDRSNTGAAFCVYRLSILFSRLDPSSNERLSTTGARRFVAALGRKAKHTCTSAHLLPSGTPLPFQHKRSVHYQVLTVSLAALPALLSPTRYIKRKLLSSIA